jgi:hypothetical protein
VLAVELIAPIAEQICEVGAVDAVRPVLVAEVDGEARRVVPTPEVSKHLIRYGYWERFCAHVHFSTRSGLCAPAWAQYDRAP